MYSIKQDGNCNLSTMSDPHHEFGGKNVLIQLKPLTEVASKVGPAPFCVCCSWLTA